MIAIIAFRFCPADFERAIDCVERAGADYSAAVARVGATNKKFQYSAGGLWAVAQGALAGPLECRLRAVGYGLDSLSGSVQSVCAVAAVEVLPARDAVFASVGAACARPEWVSLVGGDGVVSMADVAAGDVGGVSGGAQGVVDACEGLEGAGPVTEPLWALAAGCDAAAEALSALSSSFAAYVEAVGGLEGMGSMFDAEAFVTEEMAAAGDVSSEWSGLDLLKGGLKVSKTFLSNVGGLMRGEPFVPWLGRGASASDLFTSEFWAGWRASARGGYISATQGLGLGHALNRYVWDSLEEYYGLSSSVAPVTFLGTVKSNFLDVHSSNWREIKAGANTLRLGFSNAKTKLASMVSGKGLDASLADDVAEASFSAKAFGKGLKAAGRYLGYAGDVITLGSSVNDAVEKGFSKGDIAQGLGQIVKGITKIGTGKVVGAVVGSFGGPAGVAVGVVVGGIVGSLADQAVDTVFAAVFRVT